VTLKAIDHIIVCVSDLEAATAQYETLLGRSVSLTGTHPDYGTANALFNLGNTYIELLSPAGDGAFAESLRTHLKDKGEGLLGITLGTDDAEATSAEMQAKGLKASAPQPGEGHGPDGSVRRWRNVFLPQEDVLGLFMFAIEHEPDTKLRALAAPVGAEDATLHEVDHVVVNTPDGDKAISLFRDAMGIRLALDRNAKQWGARMMFFRLGGITLEVIQRYGDDKTPPMPKDAPSEYWGMAFRAENVPAAQARLAAAGVNVSEVRKGRKPGTLVATVRDSTCGVPTLIVGPDPEADDAS